MGDEQNPPGGEFQVCPFEGCSAIANRKDASSGNYSCTNPECLSRFPINGNSVRVVAIRTFPTRVSSPKEAYDVIKDALCDEIMPAQAAKKVVFELVRSKSINISTAYDIVQTILHSGLLSPERAFDIFQATML